LNHIPGTADQIDYTDDYIIGEISRIAENSNPGEGNWGNGWLSYHAILNPNTTYTVSYDIEFLTMPEGKSSVRHSIFNRNDTSNRRYVTVSELNKKYSNSAVFTSDEYGGIYMIFTVNSSKVKISNFQVEEGTQKTEYEKSTAYRDYIYLDEPLRKIGDCETCADYIDFENKKVVRNTRSVRYKVSEMSNSENYPGWKNQTIFIEDFPNQNKQLHQITSFKSNISDNIGIGINTNSMGIVWLEKSYFGKTQTEYLNNYSDLEVNIIYKTQASNTTETFEMPDLVAPRQSNIRVCDDKNVCASNIEVEYE